MSKGKLPERVFVEPITSIKLLGHEFPVSDKRPKTKKR
jgi:hypothetical protein